MLRLLALAATVFALALVAGCAPAGTSDGTGDGLHSIVPDVVGMSLTDATVALEDAGYTVGEVTGDAIDTSSALVVEQSPIASTSLPREAAVDLRVSSTR